MNCNEFESDWLNFIKHFGLTDTLSVQLLKGIVGFSAADDFDLSLDGIGGEDDLGKNIILFLNFKLVG